MAGWPPFNKPGDWGFWADGSPIVPQNFGSVAGYGDSGVDPSKAEPGGWPGFATPDPLGVDAGRYPPPGEGPVYPDSENPNAFPGQPTIWQPEASRGILPPEAIEGLIKAQLEDLKTRGRMPGRAHFYQTPMRIGPWRTLDFDGNPLPAGVVARAFMSPPVFDMRPDLKSLVGDQEAAAYPIWREATYGAGLYLFAQIFGRIHSIVPTLNVYSIEYGNIMTAKLNPSSFEQTQEPQDITQEFYDGQQTCILKWPCPGYKIWKVALQFDQLDGDPGELGTDLNIAWALY